MGCGQGACVRGGGVLRSEGCAAEERERRRKERGEGKEKGKIGKKKKKKGGKKRKKKKDREGEKGEIVHAPAGSAAPTAGWSATRASSGDTQRVARSGKRK